MKEDPTPAQERGCGVLAVSWGLSVSVYQLVVECRISAARNAVAEWLQYATCIADTTGP